MRIEDFALERYFARWEFAVRHVLAASDIEPMPLGELLSLADGDSLHRWETLSLGYTESLGLPALRESIAELYPGLDASHIITFAGAEEGVFLAMHALLSLGDHAVVVWPAYQSLHEVARSIGAEVTLVPLNPRDWSLDVGAVAAAMRPNTKVVVINFPHSPTGAQLSPEQFSRLVDLVELHGATLFSDEVYRLVEHNAPRLPTAAESTGRGVSLGVMSKAYGLAGLRIGWIATRDAALYSRLASLKDYTTICNSAPSEILSLIALRAGTTLVERALEIVRANLAIADEFFARNEGRLAWVRPRAGTVGFPQLIEGDVDELAVRLIERDGVLILPASQFGFRGNYFRLGLGRKDMQIGLDALERMLTGE
ncbi:MAG: aminotransferase class I/II-fold pyridoxal phosphate-dependent enzyme [Gemmatimonadaceae bacterium]